MASARASAPAETLALPSPATLVRAAVLVLVFVAAVGTPADADLWGHLTFGRDTVAARSIVTVDDYSFTSDRPWVNHEWLSEVLVFLAYRAGGSAALVALKVAVIGLLLALIWWHLRKTGASTDLVFGLVVLAFLGVYWRTHNVRPQLFSVLFFAVLLVALSRADAGRRRALLVLPPLFALWVNVHGGWIVGLGATGLWAAARVVDPRLPLGRRALSAAAALAAVGATLANPYGIGLWQFLAATVRLGRSDIEEWGSILTHPLALGLPWLAIAVSGVVAMWRSEHRRPDDMLLVAGLGVASFRVSRLDAFFALAVVMRLAPDFVSATRHLLPWSPSDSLAHGPARGATALTVVAVLAMLVPATVAARPFMTCLAVGGPWAPDPGAAAFVLGNDLRGRMLTWFDWGEYAIWFFGPGMQVSMDGRRETVYTDATIQAHRRFYAGNDAGWVYLHQLNPDYVWLPTRLPVTKKLADTGWVTIFRGPISTIFAHRGLGPFRTVAPPPSGPRCFPGP